MVNRNYGNRVKDDWLIFKEEEKKANVEKIKKIEWRKILVTVSTQGHRAM